MNIDKLFSSSFKLFNATISSILPFIVLYSIFFILVNYFFGFSANSENYLLLSPNVNDLISLLITYIINLFYSILIIEFIFSKMNAQKITFNINYIIISAYRITGLYFIIFIPAIIISMSLVPIIPIADILLLTIPILYFITFFSQYLIIEKQYNIIGSIIMSHTIIKDNLSKVFILIFLNIMFIMLMLYLSIIIGQFLPMANAILLNVQLYFISIFNIQFYYIINSNHQVFPDINE